MRTKITLACTECKQRNYNTMKEKKTHPDRMETKKYCRFCKTHTMHKETKQFGTSEGVLIMSENTKAPKTSWFSGLKSEFKKIVWPERKSLVRQTIAVIAVSIVVGLIIAGLDWLIQYGVNFLIGLKF